MARVLRKRKPIEGVNNIILVVSEKGVVGKSTVASNNIIYIGEVTQFIQFFCF